MAEYVDRLAVYEKACRGCTRHGDELGECYSSEPCEKLIYAFTLADPADVAPVVRCKDCVSVIGNDVKGYVCQNQLGPCYARFVPGDFSCICGESKEVYRNG